MASPLRHARHECLPFDVVVLPATATATLSAEFLKVDDGLDRISTLADDLRRNIISRLPFKEAVRTTVLARSWRCIWGSTPLFLNDAHLLPPSPGNVRAGAIDCILRSHSGPFESVHLANFYLEPHQREIALWSRLLAERGVKDLVLVRLEGPASIDLSPSMRLPVDILRCANLRRLYIGYWMFPDTSDLPDGAGVFPHLEELGIIDTRMEDHDLDHILASSPVLKKLALIGNELPVQVNLRGQSLQCVLFWLSVRSKINFVEVNAPNLERLIMWSYSTLHPLVSVVSAPVLKVLGYLNLGGGPLGFRNTIINIKVDSETSPSSMIPSVKILALNVDLRYSRDVPVLANFLRWFPNIETLHLKCECYVHMPSDNNHSESFQNLDPIECVQSQIKTVVLHEFTGHRIEMALLRYLSQKANQMRQLTLVLPHLPDERSVGEIKGELDDLLFLPWASEACTLLLLGPAKKLAWTFHRASDLSIHDPFLSDDGQELFRFVKGI
ncbi:hypothetical protein PR202_gb05636 [Eleusine coracana subsp. coracana]|uniref:FBD domain-containing protein n=1 Tax=Eleusine coracana subsp. coracana TaxID=191504 RepID=A0AAV5E761_ELECO|nr:hypothetical protein PR202_gb05636 [Eleusine coracana subsp. coracana]